MWCFSRFYFINFFILNGLYFLMMLRESSGREAIKYRRATKFDAAHGPQRLITGAGGVWSYVTEPQIRDLSNGHTQVGEDIVLECTVSSNKPQVSIQWKAPIHVNLTSDRVSISSEILFKTSTLHTTKSVYTIHNAQLYDESVYYCEVSDIDNRYDNKYGYVWVPVYNVKNHTINFYDQHASFDGTKSEIQIFVRAHPEPKFHWIDKHNKTIESNSSKKFEVQTQTTNRFTNYLCILKFKSIFEQDFGNYTLVAQNEFEQKEFVFDFNITGPPSVKLTVVDSDEKNCTIKFRTSASPKPSIKWQFLPCDQLSCFIGKHPTKPNDNFNVNGIRSSEYGLEVTSIIYVNSSESGLIQAIASNSLAESSSDQNIFHVHNGFEVYSPNLMETEDQLKIEALYKENTHIVCAVPLQDYHEEIKWYRQDKKFALNDVKVPIKGFDEYKISQINAIYSSISILSLKTDKADVGVYFCKANRKDGKTDFRGIKVEAREQPILNVVSNMLNKSVEAIIGDPLKFYCNVEGYPTPLIQWFKDDAPIETSKRMEIIDKNQTLAINYVELHDNGTYKCDISNRLNQREIQTAILTTKEKEFDWLLLTIVLLVIVLLVVSTFVFIKIRKERKLKRELEEAGLTNFEKGAIEQLNPDLRLDDQADVLPYDQKWEIPKENLILGKELGSGAFGVVRRATLRGFTGDDKDTTVAVKTVHNLSGFDHIKALASELKIMAHLGKHVNIVNLVGAYTKDIAKRKLLVVVEFCPFGSLHDYILLHSKHFIDQRNIAKNAFDWRIRSSELKRTESKVELSSIEYTTMSFSRGDSVQPEEEINDGFEEEEPEFMRSKDFFEWSFQIAKGMEYLASRRVLHGDLAARNVLLAENNVVKISDFGLSRNMYKNGVYQKKENAPLPVKWMAVESIGEAIFSTQSDVWSFGVVLWEFFSLGKTPYPGIEINQNFYKELLKGYRMEMPDYATPEIYEIMSQCWDADPMKRPTFTELAEKIGLMLEASVKNHYLDMNSPYVTMNKPTGSDADYLLLMSPPSFDKVVPSAVQSAPHYVNNISYFNMINNDPRNLVFKTENS